MTTLSNVKLSSRIKIDDYLPTVMKKQDNLVIEDKLRIEQSQFSKEELNKIINKEIDIKLTTGEKLSGVVKEVGIDNDGDFVVRITNGDWNKRITIRFNRIKSMNVSLYPYYSLEHKTYLRQNKIPRQEFRYSVQQLNDLSNKFVSINYDGKQIEGQVFKVNYKNENMSTISILLKTGEVKAIETYRLRELEVTGNTQIEHNRFKRIMKFENDVLKELNYYNDFASEPDSSEVDVALLLEKYFEAIIDYHNGKEITLSDYDYDWIKELEIRKANSVNWSEQDEEVYQSELVIAEKANSFYNRRKEFIRNVVKKAESIKWINYGVNQKQGEIDALKYLYESDVIYK